MPLAASRRTERVANGDQSSTTGGCVEPNETVRRPKIHPSIHPAARPYETPADGGARTRIMHADSTFAAAAAAAGGAVAAQRSAIVLARLCVARGSRRRVARSQLRTRARAQPPRPANPRRFALWRRRGQSRVSAAAWKSRPPICALVKDEL